MLDFPLEEEGEEAKRVFFGAEEVLGAGRRGTNVVIFRRATGDGKYEALGADVWRN